MLLDTAYSTKINSLITYPFVDVELAENLSGVQKVLVVKDPGIMLVNHIRPLDLMVHVLLSVVGEQRQVQDNRKPVAIDNEQEGQESMNSSLGDNVGVETVAEFDGVEVVTAYHIVSLP